MGTTVRNEYTSVLYPQEDVTHKQALERLLNYSSLWGWKYWYIMHDKDKKEGSDELKKPHVHLVVQTPRKMSLKTIATRLQVDENYIQPVDSLYGMLRYLCHMDDPDKYQYPVEVVKSNYKYIDYINILSTDKTFDDNLEQFMLILDEMFEAGEKITFKSVTEVCRHKGLAKWVWGHHQQVRAMIGEYATEQYEKLREKPYVMSGDEMDLEIMRKKGFVPVRGSVPFKNGT